MTTLLVPSPGVVGAVLAEDWPTGIVAATDGRPPSELALRAAHHLAGAATFGILTVVPDSSSRDRGNGWQDHATGPSTVRDLVDDQIRRVLGDTSDTWVEVRRGYPPAVLSEYAQEHGVALLVVGIGRPRVLDRLLGDESTLRLARITRTPLFAVAPDRAVPPRSIVVGTDFSASSLRAARLALAVSAPDAEILLTHVRSPSGLTPHGALRRHAEALQTGFCGRVTPVELEGDAATELLALANIRKADALCVGTQGHVLRGYGVIGAVATRVVRCSSCSLLVAPGLD